jgi:hypothetical protein
MLEVITRIDDDRQVLRGQAARQTISQLRAAHSAGEGNDLNALIIRG